MIRLLASRKSLVLSDCLNTALPVLEIEELDVSVALSEDENSGF
jgi:hypothetical protein